MSSEKNLAAPEGLEPLGEIDPSAWAVRPRRLVRGIRLKPGLVATAEIKTGDRTIASYVLDPVLKITDESLREP